MYYEKNTVILAHSKSINIELDQWDEMSTSQFILSHYLPARTFSLIFHTILITINYAKQVYKCLRIFCETDRLLFLHDSYMMLTIPIKIYNDIS